jgi:hypothetical protein
MSADIGRHGYVPSTRRDRCADCYQPRTHPIHVGSRPAPVCRRTGSHGSHGACPGIDFPQEFALLPLRVVRERNTSR